MSASAAIVATSLAIADAEDALLAAEETRRTTRAAYEAEPTLTSSLRAQLAIREERLALLRLACAQAQMRRAS